MPTDTLDFLDRVNADTRAQAEILLAVADTKVVLGNWHIACLFNAKALPDYAAMLSLTGASFGHARALYHHLAAFGRSYAWLERGRGAADILSLGVLDQAPNGWQDFVATLYLTERAAWLHASRFLDSPDHALAALTRRIGEETYFHLKYATGWAEEFGKTPGVAIQARDALLARFPQTLAWFPAVPGDVAAEARREALAQAAREFLDLLGQGGELSATADHRIHPKDAPLTRQLPLPAALYERVRFKDLEAAS